MKLEIPEKRLLEIGFRILDSMYGELTIMKGKYWDIIFVDNNNVVRLGYDKPVLKMLSVLGYLYKDQDYFLTVIPVEKSDYVRVLKAWVKEHHKMRVGTTVPEIVLLEIWVEEHHKIRV